jgi:tetratricopeptide (TPR) repeat protein
MAERSMTEIPRSETSGDALQAAAEDHFYRAVDCIADGDSDGAIAAFREALRCDSGHVDAWHGLIRALQDCGQLDEAVAQALRLAEEFPGDVLIHTRLSILYQMQGKIAEAEAESTRAKVLGWKQALQNKPAPAE